MSDTSSRPGPCPQGLRESKSRRLWRSSASLALALGRRSDDMCGVSSCKPRKRRPRRRQLWQQVSHVDPLQANPSVSEFSQRLRVPSP